MTTEGTTEGLTARSMVEHIAAQGVTHMVTLPDSETNFMYDNMTESGMEVVPIAREGEAIAIAAGLWIANQKPAIMIQNSGLFESGDALRGLGIGIDLPLVMFIGYRGYTRHGDTPIAQHNSWSRSSTPGVRRTGSLRRTTSWTGSHSPSKRRKRLQSP